MHPERELIRLGVHKAHLRSRIASHRAECVQAVTVLTKPLDWLDRAVALWRKFSPVTKIAAVPLGLLLERTNVPRMKRIGTFLRWAPLAVTAVRGIMALPRGRP